MKYQITESELLPLPMLDVIEPELGVQVITNGGKMWVNIDGQCVLRVQGAPEIEVQQE